MKNHIMRAAWTSWLEVREERLDQLASDKARTAGLSRHATLLHPAAALLCLLQQAACMACICHILLQEIRQHRRALGALLWHQANLSS